MLSPTHSVTKKKITKSRNSNFVSNFFSPTTFTDEDIPSKRGFMEMNNIPRAPRRYTRKRCASQPFPSLQVEKSIKLNRQLGEPAAVVSVSNIKVIRGEAWSIGGTAITTFSGESLMTRRAPVMMSWCADWYGDGEKRLCCCSRR